MNDFKKYSFSQDFVEFLIKSCEGFIAGEQFDKTLELLETEAFRSFFTKPSENNLIRIISSLFDRKRFLIELADYPHHAEIICAIASHSNYLTDIVVRHPEFLHQLFNETYLEQKLTEEKLEDELKDLTGRFKSPERKIKFIRIFKKKYLLKIGICDILGYNKLSVTTADLSKLARVISKILFEICYDEICTKNSIPVDNNRYCLCALGKMGGNELNYSSDIDLIVFYDKNDVINDHKKEFHEVITETVQLFIKRATEITEDTYIYRVDFRLRPDGRNALLARTITDYMKYYETRGEQWERQMLIKLGFVAGSNKMYKTFRDFINKFVYPATILEPISVHIKKMKASIEDRLKDEQNIKLSRGGIRDIEFSVQALQLMNGGKFSDVRTGSSLKAIKHLHDHNLLNGQEKDLFEKSYIIYRRIEHYLQLMNDKQTHSIPQSGDTAYKLALYLGFKNYDEFDREIGIMKNGVRKIYESILGGADIDVVNAYSNVNFSNEVKAKKDLLFLEKGISIIGEKNFDSATINAFIKIEASLIKYLENSTQPDVVLENFARVIKNSIFPSIWYNTFRDEVFFFSFLTICEFSQRAVNILVTDKAMGDFLLSKSIFTDDLESLFYLSSKQFLFVLSVLQILDKLPPYKFSQHLSSYVLHKLQEAITNKSIDYNFFIAGLGSFGNEEMNFSSDVDLIVVIENPDKLPEAQKDFQEILADIQKNLPYFEIDFRLRPEGRNSPLVWDISGYEKYFETRLQFWELQALTKIKFVAGNTGLYERFSRLIKEKLGCYAEDEIIKSILDMYSRKLKAKAPLGSTINLKNSNGMLGTIDTIVQLNLFTNNFTPDEILNTTAKDKFNLLAERHPESAGKLEERYLFLKTTEVTIQNLFDQIKPQFPKDKLKQETVAKKLNFESAKTLEDKLNTVTNMNIKELNKWREK